MTRIRPLKGLFRVSDVAWGATQGKEASGLCSTRGLVSQDATYRTTSHGHSEGDLFAVSERAAVDGDVVNLLPGCWSAQAWGLENPKRGELSEDGLAD